MWVKFIKYVNVDVETGNFKKEHLWDGGRIREVIKQKQKRGYLEEIRDMKHLSEVLQDYDDFEIIQGK